MLGPDSAESRSGHLIAAGARSGLEATDNGTKNSERDKTLFMAVRIDSKQQH